MGSLDVAAYAPLVSDSPAATGMRRAAVRMFARDGFGGTSTADRKHLQAGQPRCLLIRKSCCTRSR